MSAEVMGDIKNLVVFNRRLGCTDESATDEEQAEKILYYYPEDTSLYSQLSRMTMIESLIEFSAKFSDDPIDVVLMAGSLWGFYQCEPDVWIVVAIDTHISSIDRGGSLMYYKHTPNGEGLVKALEKMYYMYKSFFGTIGVMLRHGNKYSTVKSGQNDCCDDDSPGWNMIRKVASLRKKIRKLGLELRQVVQDIEVTRNYEATKNEEVINDEDREHVQEDSEVETPRDEDVNERNSEQLGIRSGTTTLAELTALQKTIIDSINRKEEELSSVIGPVPDIGSHIEYQNITYAPLIVKNVMSIFSRWYMNSGELWSPSGINGMWGMHFLAIGHPSYFCVERLRRAISSTMNTLLDSDSDVGGACNRQELAKCILMYDGQVIWNDFFDHDIVHFYEFLRIQQNTSLREIATFIRNASSTSLPFAEKMTSARKKSINKDDSINDEKVNAIQKFQSFSRRFSVTRRNSSMSSSANLQKKNSQEIIEAYTKDYRERKGFLASGWNSVDLMSASPPSLINESGREGEALMSYHSERCVKTCTHTHNGNEDEEEDIDLSEERGTHIWCPRLFSPIRTCDDDNAHSGLDTLDEAQQSICLGRAVIYQHKGFMAVVVLPDWSSPQDFHDNLTSCSNCGNEKEGIQVDLFSFCTLLQMNLSSAIMLSLDDKVSTFTLTASSPSPNLEIPDGVSFVCCNNLNMAFKAVNVYRSSSPHLLSWPQPLQPGSEHILSLLEHRPHQYPLSCGQLIGSFQPGVAAAVTDITTALLSRTVSEACIRVTSAFRGGIWVTGRSLSDRHIVFVLEGCSTINDVHDVINKVLKSMLGNILL